MKIEIIDKLGEQIRENGPSILTGLGVIGLVSTVGLAIKATHDFDSEEHKNNKEKFKSILKHYYPVAILGVGSIGCIIGSNTMNMKRNLALAGAYKISENKITEYKDKLFGISKEKNEEKTKQNVVIFGDGDVDCLDPISGRYFKSNIIKIKDAIHNINEMLYSGERPDLNDFYQFLGLDEIDLYINMQWDPKYGPIRLEFDTELTEKSKPVLVIDFDTRPVYRENY